MECPAKVCEREEGEGETWSAQQRCVREKRVREKHGVPSKGV